MKKYTTVRKSHCGICGKRLSEMTASGMIRWHPGRVDDKGIFLQGPQEKQQWAAERPHMMRISGTNEKERK